MFVFPLRPSGSGTLNDGGSYLYAQYGRTLHARGRAEPRNSVEPVRRWRYLHRVMRTKRKLKVLVYQLTELHPTRYTRDIRDRFELANTSKWGTSPVVEFPGSYAVKPYLCIIIIIENCIGQGFPSPGAKLLESYRFLPYKYSHVKFLKRTNPVS